MHDWPISSDSHLKPGWSVHERFAYRVSLCRQVAQNILPNRRNVPQKQADCLGCSKSVAFSSHCCRVENTSPPLFYCMAVESNEKIYLQCRVCIRFFLEATVASSAEGANPREKHLIHNMVKLKRHNWNITGTACLRSGNCRTEAGPCCESDAALKATCWQQAWFCAPFRLVEAGLNNPPIDTNREKVCPFCPKSELVWAVYWLQSQSATTAKITSS